MGTEVEVVPKKEIPIMWKGRKETVVIKKLTFGEKGDIRDQSVETRLIGNIMQGTIHMAKFQQLAVWKSLVKAPFEISLKGVRNLYELGDLLYEEVEKFSKMTESKKVKSRGPSQPEESTPKSSAI